MAGLAGVADKGPVRAKVAMVKFGVLLTGWGTVIANLLMTTEYDPNPSDTVKFERAIADYTHTIKLEDAAKGYAMFKHKDDGCIKVVLKP